LPITTIQASIIRLNYRRIARAGLACCSFLTAVGCPQLAQAVISGEVYTAPSYGYGRVEARLRFAAGDGVVGSFFLWKDGSELPGRFWNELDFEKVGADCHFQTNVIYGNPPSNHGQNHPPDSDPCGTFHTYAYEWTPEYIAWLVDGVEIRRETGATAAAFADNAPSGMQIRLNVWPGDATFGGNFNPDILPVHQYVDWVQFSAFEGGTFTFAWREDFDGRTLPVEWATASWGSPKNLSTHDARNINLIDGYLVISLTADDATGPAGAMPVASGGSSGDGQAGGCSMDAPGEGRSSALLGALAVCAIAFARRRGRLLRDPKTA
jgi:endo-1,3-1,4-beta-glycanase ExoK